MNTMNSESNQPQNENLLIDDLFMLGLEEKAAELEITVDYYLAEFC